MQGKRTEDYVAVMKYIHDKHPEMNPEWCMSDFEPAMRISAKTIFTTIKVCGCHFHFSQVCSS